MVELFYNIWPFTTKKICPEVKIGGFKILANTK